MNKRNAMWDSWVLLLKGAKSFIESKRNYFVCVALDSYYMMYGGEDISYDALCSLKREIHERLNGSSSVEKWLYHYHKIPMEEFTQDVMREYRMAWIDLMIKEFE